MSPVNVVGDWLFGGLPGAAGVVPVLHRVIAARRARRRGAGRVVGGGLREAPLFPMRAEHLVAAAGGERVVLLAMRRLSLPVGRRRLQQWLVARPLGGVAPGVAVDQQCFGVAQPVNQDGPADEVGATRLPSAEAVLDQGGIGGHANWVRHRWEGRTGHAPARTTAMKR